MRAGRDVLPTLDTAPGEWLLSDGLGGSASGPVAGPALRRTQALLAASGPHGGHHVLLLRFEERATAGAAALDLTAPAAVESFAGAPWPTWGLRAGEARIEKTVLAIPGHAAVVVTWRHLEGPAVRLTASPLVVARDPGSLQRESPEMRGPTQGVPGRVTIETLPGRPSLTLWHNGAFLPARLWKRVGYALDRGASEEALVPGHLEATLGPGAALHVVASAEPDLFRALAAGERLGVPPPRSLAGCVAALESGARALGERWLSQALAGADFTARQAAAAHGGEGAAAARRREPLIGAGDRVAAALACQLQAGLARRGSRLTLLESLPGAAERGDAALRAAHALVTLRAFEPAREVLRGFLEHLDEGLAPHGFDPADGRPLHGEAAPALWLVSAAEFHVRRGGDTTFLETALAPLQSVIEAYRSGTRHGIRVDADGLLADGRGAAAAKRAGLNALWYHALISMAQLARLAGRRESGAFYLAWAREHQTRFNERLWDEARGICLDLGADGAALPAGPSGVLAASLAPAVLPAERARRLLEGLARERLLPFGMRDPAGAPRASSEWLGPFLMGWLRAHQRGDAARGQVREWLAPIVRALETGAAGIPAAVEVAPHGTGGAAPAPAGDPLSVVAAADLLRVWVEELEHPEPGAGAGA